MADFIKINDFQAKIRAELDRTTDSLDELQRQNENRIEAYYQQIEEWIKNAFIPYSEIFQTWKLMCYHSVRDIDNMEFLEIGIVGKDSHDYSICLYINRPGDVFTFYVGSQHYKARKEDIIFQWADIKPKIMEVLEKMSYSLNLAMDRRKAEEESLSAKLDNFKL